MEMTSVNSSNINGVGYDEESETLQVEFKNGTQYQYFDVPVNEFEALRDSDSVGGYLASNIKGSYRYTRV